MKKITHLLKISLVSVLLQVVPGFSLQLSSADTTKSIKYDRLNASRPKLVVYLVFDQMRADYLLKFKDEFVKNSSSKLGGFRYFMENSAYFPYAEYNVLQNMTCPGHAMISTGSWPINTGISLNEWFDKQTKKTIYCADDEKFDKSPRRLATTNVSDEFKSSDVPSKVYGVALKDRSAIMLAGHKADGALWFNEKNWEWESSSYYPKLPEWLADWNAELKKNKGDKNWLATKWGVEATINLAQQVINKEKMGRNNGTDFLFMSFSTHDILGHNFGPNSKEMKNLTLDEDKELSRFVNFMKTKFKLSQEVLFVLTADHGIPATVEYSTRNKIQAEYINEIEMIEKTYNEINKIYSPKEKQEWFSAVKSLHYYVNDEVIDKLKINKKDFLEECRKIILRQNQVEDVLIPQNFKWERIISPQIRSQVDNSFVGSEWGDLVLVPKPYFMNKSKIVTVNHITGYVYDRTVPLMLSGAAFKNQTYFEKAYIVDIAPTVAAVLKTLPGAKSDGRILYEIFKN